MKKKTFHRLKNNIGLLVHEKYNSRCTNCGGNKSLCVHHIVPMSPDSPNYNDIDNLTLLCRSCHMSYHRRAQDISPPSYVGLKKGWNNGRRGNNPPVICKVEGCELLQHGRALCKKHYEYRRRRGLL